MKTCIGFISPPNWFDPAPSEFPDTVEQDVSTQQAPILSPSFDYSLEAVASSADDLRLCAESLKMAGCGLIAQVGSPFSWALAESEDEARRRCRFLAETTGLPAIMTGLAIVDALRAYGVGKIAVNCTYYDDSWRDAFASFMTACGFQVVHASHLIGQGLVDPDASFGELGWSMNDALTSRSVLRVAELAPDAEAIVVTGAGARTLNILSGLEEKTERPIVAADTALYWAIAREMKLTLKSGMGKLSRLA